MPSLSSTVGAEPIPVPSGTANSRIADVAVDGLLAYLGHWIKYALDPKLAVLLGPDPALQITDACPTANRFAYDPKGWWVQCILNTKLPGLWIWRKSWKRIEYSTLYSWRESTIGLLYAFPEVLGPRGLPTWTAIPEVVDAAVTRAHQRGSHPTFAYCDKPAGTFFPHTITAPGVLRWQYLDSTQALEAAGPATGSGAGGMPDIGLEQYVYMTLRGTIVLHEKVLNDTLLDPDDVNNGIAVGISVNEQGDMNSPLHLMDRAFPGPDGSSD